jgi:tRNA nucleotidyltransferase (CCA-adding enzyme)
MRKVKTNINGTLTSDEKEIMDIIDKVAKSRFPGTQPRVAGGWTRDHMIGIESDDIDIMTDNISGEVFAQAVAEFLGIKDPHVIKSNPEKSKHLATAEMRIKPSSGTEYVIQFAGARQEVYDEKSRNPTIQPATAQEDAQRRDLTINSMFYNIDTKEIEDFTGKGITDLITNTIRTPLDPLKTFSDDPLRIFRTVRFCAKYNGKISAETFEALKNPELINKLKTKISKDRIGKEMVKIISNPNVNVAFDILKETGLMDSIISDAIKGTKYEGKISNVEMSQNNAHHKLTLWGHTMQVVSNVLSKYQDAQEEKKIAMVLAALFHDLGKLFSEIRGESKSHPGSTSYHGHEDESAEIAKLILKYMGLESYAQEVSNLAKYHMQAHTFVRDDSSEKSLRKFIRKMGEESLNYLDVLNLSIADAYSKDKIVDDETVATYKNLENRLQQALMSLSPTSETKIEPILNGNEIMQILNIKPGMYMKEITEFVKELKDENPNITKEEAAQKIKEKYSHLSTQQNVVNSPKRNKIQPNQPSQQSQQTPETKEASNSDSEQDKPQASTCPKHLLKQKSNDIIQKLNKNNLYEVNVIMKELMEKYSKDPFIARLIAINTLNVLIRDTSIKDNELLRFLSSKTENNFSDYILNAYVLGIALIIKTSAEEESIINMTKKVLTISPGTLKSVIECLPENKIYYQNTYNKIKSLLKGMEI